MTADREITVHDLLTMTGGMTNTWWHRVFEPSVYGVVPQLLKDAGVYDDMSGPPTTLEENIKTLAQVPLIAQPGTMFDYSNNSVDTLCRLVEVVSGLDFDTYQRRNVLDPLRMHETWFFTPEDQHHRIAAVYQAGRDEKVTEAAPLGLGMLGPGAAFSPHHTYFSGAAGLHGTTADYFRFAQMLLNGGELDEVRVLSPMSVRLMTTNQIGDLQNWQLTQNKWGYMVDIQEGENAPSGSIHYLGRAGRVQLAGVLLHQVRQQPASRHSDHDDEHSGLRRGVAAQPAAGRRGDRGCDGLISRCSPSPAGSYPGRAGPRPARHPGARLAWGGAVVGSGDHRPGRAVGRADQRGRRLRDAGDLSRARRARIPAGHGDDVERDRPDHRIDHRRGGVPQRAGGSGASARAIRRCASFLGAIVGAVLLLKLPADAFETIVPVLVGISVILVLVQPLLSRRLSNRTVVDRTDRPRCSTC